MCDGAEIVVNGNCGWSVGENLMSGSIAVHGNGGSSAGATIRGGRVFIEGDTGARTGIADEGRHRWSWAARSATCPAS